MDGGAEATVQLILSIDAAANFQLARALSIGQKRIRRLFDCKFDIAVSGFRLFYVANNVNKPHQKNAIEEIVSDRAIGASPDLNVLDGSAKSIKLATLTLSALPNGRQSSSI